VNSTVLGPQIVVFELFFGAAAGNRPKGGSSGSANHPDHLLYREIGDKLVELNGIEPSTS
jgi:hypothetical protein